MAEQPVPRKPRNEKGPNSNNNSDLDPAPSLSKFLRKSLVVVVIIVLVPLFPSRAPDSVNQNLLSRGWELVHLLVVGIAVCYGLFSRRNDYDVDKETASSSSKYENSQSHVSRLLQMSSVFDEEGETLDGYGEESSRQTWSSQYTRNEPVLVVAANESSNGGVTASRFRNGEKPLILPVRRLKSRVLESKEVENGADRLYRRSDSESNWRNEMDVKEKAEDNVVLPSPIPWRSRSGRMELEGVDGFEMKILNEGFEFWPGRLESGRPTSSRPSSTSSTPKILSPSHSIDLSPRRSSVVEHVESPEMKVKDVEDGLKRKNFYKRSPTPLAPPLPPPTFYKSHLVHSSCGKAETSSEKELKAVSSDKEIRRSGMSEAKDLIRSSTLEEMMRRINSSNERIPDSQIGNGGPAVGKPARTTKAGDSVGVRVARDVQEADTEKNWKDVMEAPVERIGRKLTPIDQTSAWNKKPSQEQDTKIPNIHMVPTSMFSEPLKEEKKLFEDSVTVESDSDSEDDVKQTLEPIKEESETVSPVVPDVGPDVDKKADEFIAKFREQIRLQRIASIKRSANQVTGKLSED